MRKILLIMFFVISAVGIAMAGKPEIKFASTSHDFGTIHEKNGRVTAVYEFTNTGDAPLSIVTVTNGGCGCTKPSFPLEPIAPGKSGVIKITFDPRGRAGEFNRTVKVKTNAGKSRNKLTFSGVIVP